MTVLDLHAYILFNYIVWDFVFFRIIFYGGSVIFNYICVFADLAWMYEMGLFCIEITLFPEKLKWKVSDWSVLALYDCMRTFYC